MRWRMSCNPAKKDSGKLSLPARVYPKDIMQYQQLGNTGVFVSRLCLGAMTFGGATTSIWSAIGALGQWPTREDAEGLSGGERLVGHVPRGNAPGDVEPGRSRRRGAPGIRAPQSIAVHRGVGPWREIEGRGDGVGEHAAEGAREGHLLLTEGTHPRQYPLEGFFD